MWKMLEHSFNIQDITKTEDELNFKEKTLVQLKDNTDGMRRVEHE